MMKPKLTELALKDLHFDPENPRLPQRLKHAQEPDVLRYLLLECNVVELMLSIVQQGFFLGEPLLVVPDNKGGYTVVEGNRRLGALKLLQADMPIPVMPTQVGQARQSGSHFPTSIPAIIFSHRDEILTYLGYRHITGIKEWDALAKARYLRQLRDKHGSDDVEAHKSLAREIGSKAPHVAKLLTGLTLVERARDTGLLDRLSLDEDNIPFSLLTTGIGYENICKFIGLENGSDVRADALKPQEFEEFFRWVFDKGSRNKTILGDSRNFDQLARVVANDSALDKLRSGYSLKEADLYTSGPLDALRSLLREAEERIESAQAALKVAADGVNSSDLEVTDRIRKAASILHGSLAGLLNPDE